MADESLVAGYASAEFHPDGVLLGTGTQDGVVRVWDVKGQKVRTGGAYASYPGFRL